MSKQGASGLQIDEWPALQRFMWKVQRAGWIVMAAVVVAACAGFIGAGPMSKATVLSAQGQLVAEYERFVRYGAPTALTLRLTNPAPAQGELRLWVQRAYLEQVRIERVVPEPERVELAGQRLVYVFRLAPGPVVAAVRFDVKLDAVGEVQGGAGLDGGAEVHFRHFAYP